jgi:hypothetical protein
MKRAGGLLLISILASISADAVSVIDQKLVALHQRCVFQKFAQGVKRARQFDPDLLRKSVAECEPLLQSQKTKIVDLTGDPAFADQVLAKVREASKRGVTVAVIAYFGRGNQPSPAQAK